MYGLPHVPDACDFYEEVRVTLSSRKIRKRSLKWKIKCKDSEFCYVSSYLLVYLFSFVCSFLA
jgi:hypothetical protein